MIVAAVLVAGGSGSRLGAAVPKAFVEVAGASLLQHCLDRFTRHPQVRDVVAVVPAGVTVAGARTVVGGASRQQSVAAGLAALDADVQAVLVHDVARPFVPDQVITAVIEALGTAEAVIPVVPVTDTVRRVDAAGVLHETVDRATLVAVQTPQGFRRAVIEQAHRDSAGTDATDDAVLVESLGLPVVAVPGSDLAFKITTPADLARAEALAARA